MAVTTRASNRDNAAPPIADNTHSESTAEEEVEVETETEGCIRREIPSRTIDDSDDMDCPVGPANMGIATTAIDAEEEAEEEEDTVRTGE